MPTVTLQPAETKGIDTFVLDGSTNDRSTGEGMRVGWTSSPKEARALVEFDLTTVLAKTLRAREISSVTLTLNHKSDQNFTSAHTKDVSIQVLNGSFSESATWVYRDGSSESWTTAGGDVLVAPGTVTTTYTGDSNLVITSTTPTAGNLLYQVHDAIKNRAFKYRFLVKMESGSPYRYVNFWSSSAGSESDRPKLDITYSRKRILTPMRSHSTKPSNMRRPRSSK